MAVMATIWVGLCYTAKAEDTIGATPEEIMPPALIDADNDGVIDIEDNCASVFNPGQENADGDRYGDACNKEQSERKWREEVITKISWLFPPSTPPRAPASSPPQRG